MKLIALRNDDPFPTRKIMEAVVSQGGAHGIKLDEQRRRCRILDALEKVPAEAESLTLEDADHALLSKLLADFPFGLAHPKLLRVIDEMIDAKEPPAS